MVGIFSNEEAVVRLAGSFLVEINDEWAIAERRYLSEGSMAKLYDTGQDEEPRREVEGATSELLAS